MVWNVSCLLLLGQVRTHKKALTSFPLFKYLQVTFPLAGRIETICTHSLPSPAPHHLSQFSFGAGRKAETRVSATENEKQSEEKSAPEGKRALQEAEIEHSREIRASKTEINQWRIQFFATEGEGGPERKQNRGARNRRTRH